MTINYSWLYILTVIIDFQLKHNTLFCLINTYKHLQLNSHNEKNLISIKLRLDKYVLVPKHLKIIKNFISKKFISIY